MTPVKRFKCCVLGPARPTLYVRVTYSSLAAFPRVASSLNAREIIALLRFSLRSKYLARSYKSRTCHLPRRTPSERPERPCSPQKAYKMSRTCNLPGRTPSDRPERPCSFQKAYKMWFPKNTTLFGNENAKKQIMDMSRRFT